MKSVCPKAGTLSGYGLGTSASWLPDSLSPLRGDRPSMVASRDSMRLREDVVTGTPDACCSAAYSRTACTHAVGI
jgi:hypothetical protein